MNRIIMLDNGLRMAYQYDPHVHSVCWGVAVNAGSRNETVACAGISHMIEHMCFKGTERRSAYDIAVEMDNLGANLNAFTNKEMTFFYVQCIDECIEQCCDLLADVVLHHTFDAAELEKEKHVVCEEIDMYADTPDDVCGELAATAYWGDAPLGRPILGNKQNVMSFTPESLFAYEKQWYVGSNVVLSVVGNITEQEAVRLAKRYFVFPAGEVVRPAAAVPLEGNRQCGKEKDVEQTNIILTFRGLPYNSPQWAACEIFDCIFGGGLSSILFQRVREQQGLAYSVYSYPSSYRDAGAFSVYVGTNPAKVERALATVHDIIEELKQNGITPQQLQSGRMQSKSSYVLGVESDMSLMRVMAKRLLLEGQPFDAEQEIQALSKVTVEDVNALIAYLFACPPSVGIVAKKIKRDYTSIFNGSKHGQQ